VDSRRNFLRGLAHAATRAPRGERSGDDSAPVPRPPAGGAAGGEPGTGAPAERPRYADALADPDWGADAQAAVERASVLVLGAGALAAPVAGYLAGAGVGRLGLVDEGTVELSELHAQHLHFTPDVGIPRAHSAAAKLTFLNPEIVVEPYQVTIGAENAGALLAGHDLVVDCTGDPALRQLVNATCCAKRVALVTVEARRRAATVWFVQPGVSACLYCAGAAVDPSSAGPDSAWSGPVLGLAGSLQAMVALAVLAGRPPAPPSTALAIALDRPGLERLSVARRTDCPVCGDR
jgi:molybdopterin/thiamine biosynthesis adenylyltransferase